MCLYSFSGAIQSDLERCFQRDGGGMHEGNDRVPRMKSANFEALECTELSPSIFHSQPSEILSQRSVAPSVMLTYHSCFPPKDQTPVCSDKVAECTQKRKLLLPSIANSHRLPCLPTLVCLGVAETIVRLTCDCMLLNSEPRTFALRLSARTYHRRHSLDKFMTKSLNAK